MANLIELTAYYKSIPNLDRACTSVLENSLSIFLPFKRIDKSNIHKKFLENNQVIEIKNDVFEKVEIRDRLLGQTHKDILECLLTMKKIFDKDDAQFKIQTTAYEITKLLNKNIGKKKWILEKIKEIKGCNINIYNQSTTKIDFTFSFIDDILILNENEIEIRFSKGYTYFLMKNELIDYSKYIKKIMTIETEVKKIQKNQNLRRGINSEFIKGVVRYMLTHKGNNSQISIDNFIDKIKYDSIMTDEELNDNLTDLKREDIQKMLLDKFGIYLTNNNLTITFNKKLEDNKYHFQPDEDTRDLFEGV